MDSPRKRSAAGGRKSGGLRFSTGASSAAAKAIRKGLVAYNTAMAGPSRYRVLWVVARDSAGKVQGGLRGGTYWHWLYVEWLWVAEAWRKRGTGSRLLRQAEQIARKRGCVGVYLDTFSFQAPGFYRKQGYKKIGQLAGLPPRGTRIWFSKAL